MEMRENFSADLQAIIIDRDVSESKMKNALCLKIDLPKFSGYECKMDFYMFKTKFRKLVETTRTKAVLLESFGDADIDKSGSLWKIKGDGKIGNAIAGLINALSELSSLASEHNMEGQLYEGGGLVKIMTSSLSGFSLFTKNMNIEEAEEDVEVTEVSGEVNMKKE